MKKIITKFWGVGLILMLLSTLFIAATPVSAADPLNWEMVVTGPSTMFYGLAPLSDVIDYASNDGMTMYAIISTFGGVTANVSTTMGEPAGPVGDGLGDTYTFTYVNENGVAAHTATVVISCNATATSGGPTLTLAAGDAGITDVTNVNATHTVGDATAGAFQIKNAAGTVLATFTFAGVITDGVVNTGANLLLQSTMGGAMWSNITTRLPALASLDYVAMAPDDANVVIVGTAAPTAGVALAITTNGGATFTSMGAISPGAVLALSIKGIAVSPVVTGGYRYVSAYGSSATPKAALYYYNYGAGVGAWKDAVTGGFTGVVFTPAAAATMDNIVAFQFSPNFPSDYMGVALSEDVGGASLGTMRLHILSFNGLGNWDTGISTGYPVVITSTYDANPATAFAVNKASLALLPEYDGGDESLRIGFVGAAITDASAGTGTADGGVWRCVDNAAAAKIYGSATSGVNIASVATDGTNLAAGSYDTNNVFRSADPLIATPTFLGARSLKRIGIDAGSNDMVNVKFVGENLFGSKYGTASALSKSTDYGNTWNDFTLLDSALTTIDDIYYSADGATWYISAHDAYSSSVYRMAPFVLQRVLSVAVGPDFMLRGIASDANVIYAADEGGLVLYYSADGGVSRWYQRSSIPAAITDLAVESKEVIYIGSGINVYKSANSGFTWSTAIISRLSGANVVYSMVSLGENNLVIGGSAGGVVWTTDGGTTWFPAMGVLNTFSAVQVAATGLTTGSYVFAAERANNQVWRCEVSPANFLGEFKQMNMPAATSGEVNIGLMLQNGVLYALSTDGATSYINRSGAPAIPGTHTAVFWGTRWIEAGISFPTAIQSVTALRVSLGAPGTIKLYSVGAFFGAPTIWYYDDTLALGAPKLIIPAEGKRIEIISPLTGAVQAVNFSWNRISLATGYSLFIALDKGFTQLIVPPIAVPSSLDPVSSIQAGTNFQPGNTYYWKVAASTPIGSGFSEARSFVVSPTAASVPTIASPANGAIVTSTKPAFSWTPVSGTTMYDFQLSEGTAFAAPVYATQVANAGVQLPLNVTLEQGKTYFWRVRALLPVQGDWSTIANITIAEAVPVVVPTPPVVIQQMPAPIINIPAAPPAQQIVIPAQPAEKVINPTYIWAIIIIGAVLVIAVIVLIVRTRRTV
jgi:hypothetical protein